MGERRMTRREVLGALSVSGAAFSLGCGGESLPSAPTDISASAGTSGACAVTPNETVGPYPSLADFLRSDIREGKPGVALRLTITVVNVNANCSGVANATVDIWQCDAEGRYSQYAQPGYNGTGETFLRGVQLTDANGLHGHLHRGNLTLRSGVRRGRTLLARSGDSCRPDRRRDSRPGTG